MMQDSDKDINKKGRRTCIDVIGLGVAEHALLTPAAQQAIQQAEVIIGSARQLAVIRQLLTDNIDEHQAQAKPEPKQVILPPLSQLLALLAAHQQQRVVILASGDPLHYGIGRWLLTKFGKDNLHFHAGISSIQAACHALGLALQDVEVLSLHGRPLAKIRTRLKTKQTLVILTDKHSQPQHLAEECINAGFDQSIIWVCELLGYAQQRIRAFTATQLIAASALSFDPLHVSVVEPLGTGGILPNFPGIEDQHFVTDREAGKGMITKREVRLQILSLMQPAKGDVIWDIGAGCGGVAVELAYWQQDAKVYAIEHHPARLSCLAANQQRFGVVANLAIIAGRAPAELATLPVANKVFIGGSDGELASVLALSWQQLPAGGVLVASAVTETTKYQLQHFAQSLSDQQTETLQVAISKGTKLAGQLMYKPNLPVTLFKFSKYEEVDNEK